MDELHETAEAYYAAAAASIKGNAKEFFNTMDQDGDRGVSLHEYLAYMKREGYIQMANPGFFKALNKSGSGKLSFMEVMTLYYIVESGRQFCDGCGEFIKGLFFTCSKCFDDYGSTFNVCPTCFKVGLYVHNHNQFLDNYVLLETKRWAALKEKAAAVEKLKTTSYKATTTFESNLLHSEPCSSSTQIIVYCGDPNKKKNWMGKLKSLATQAAAANCSIM